jgi:hypothetical protein
LYKQVVPTVLDRTNTIDYLEGFRLVAIYFLAGIAGKSMSLLIYIIARKELFISVANCLHSSDHVPHPVNSEFSSTKMLHLGCQVFTLWFSRSYTTDNIWHFCSTTKNRTIQNNSNRVFCCFCHSDSCKRSKFLFV